MTLKAGTRLGPFEITASIGAGGMGVVYLALDTRLDRKVAIKALPEHFAANPDRLARFEREAKTLAQLHHANIATIFGVEHQEDRRYLILEFVDGESLARRLEKGPIPVDEALEIAVQIASGLEAAHKADVIHRDLKPGNVIITVAGDAKVVDFGLARMSESSPSTGAHSRSPTRTTPAQASPTTPGIILGTAGYMSPEQARGRTVDKRTDIWSFGVTLFEMLTRENPFVGETVTDSIGAVIHKEPDWSLLPADTPMPVRLLLRQCLAKDRKHRLHDIADARVQLESAIADPTASGIEVASTGSQGRRRVATLIIAGATLAGVLLGAFAMQRLSTARPGEVAPVLTKPIAFDIDVSGLGILALPESTSDIAVSRDGQLVAFEIQADGGKAIAVRDLSTNAVGIVEGASPGYGPFFSPNGRHIGSFLGGRLWRASLAGGPPTSISHFEDRPNGRIAWLSTDQIVYANGDRIRVVDAGGGEPRDVASRDTIRIGGFNHVCPTPDERGVLAGASHGDTIEDFSIVHVDLDTGNITHVIDRGAQPAVIGDEYVVFLRDSSLFAVRFDFEQLRPIGDPQIVLENVRTNSWGEVSQFDVSPAGVIAFIPGKRVIEDRRLVRVSRTGDVTPVSEAGAFEGYLDVSPDGRYAAVVTLQLKEQVRILDIERQFMRSVPGAGHGTTEPVFSANGSSIAYQRHNGEGKGSSLGVAPVGSGGPARVLIENFPSRMWPKTWSADGRYIVFVGPGGNALLDLDTAEMVEIQAEEGPFRLPQFSPDGRWLAYNKRNAGVNNVYVSRFPYDNSAWPVSVMAGYRPKWSMAGDAIYFINDADQMCMVTFGVGENDAPIIGDTEVLFDARDIAARAWGIVFDVTPEDDFIMIASSPWERLDARINVIVNWDQTVREALRADLD